MDEEKHMHWQLVPRYNEAGFDVFAYLPKKTKDFSRAPQLSEYIKETFAAHRKGH